MPTTETSDAILMLLRQQSDTLRELKADQGKQTSELHSIRVEQAGVAARLEAMTSIPTRVNQLELHLAQHAAKLAQHGELHTAHTDSLIALRSEADKRTGWSGPVGKIAVGTITALLVLILGAVLALVGIRSAKAGEPVTLEPAAKCWAVPAKAPPKFLLV